MTAPLFRNFVMALLALGVPAMVAIAHPAHARGRSETQIGAIEGGIRVRRLVFKTPRTRGNAALPGAPRLAEQHICPARA